MPTGVHEEPAHDHIVIAITSEPLVDKAIASDGELLCNDEDIIASVHATNLADEQVLNTFIDEALWDNHINELEQTLGNGKVKAAYMVHPGTTFNTT